ncbi:hypothetical protein D3C86_1830880 [compost metagenome]
MLSEGRGTLFPFTVIGAPELKDKYDFSFTPVRIPNMSATPIHLNKPCYGLDLRTVDLQKLRASKQIDLSWLIETYQNYPNQKIFFDHKQSKEIVVFDKLAGGSALREAIVAGKSADEIRKSWEPGLATYKEMRKKYLIYD